MAAQVEIDALAMSDPKSITLFFENLKTGDRSAATELWNRFFPRLLAQARRALSGQPQSVHDAEDAVQSAFIAFWQQVERGDFEGEMNRDHLWRILLTITHRRALMHQRREAAQKRGGGASGKRELFPVDQLMAQCPAEDFDLACEELLTSLDDGEKQQIALQKLMGYTNAEIARSLNCTTRKVERKLQMIRREWEEAHF